MIALVRWPWNVARFGLKMLGTAGTLALSLLPLSALILAYPAINPQESVLSDSAGRMSSWRRLGTRLFAVLVGLTVLVGVLAVSVELVTRFANGPGQKLLLENGQFSEVLRKLTPALSDVMPPRDKQQKEAMLAAMPEPVRAFYTTPLHKQLPDVAVKYWPIVAFVMYALDVLMLLFIGRVPLAYNLRNIRVRWLTNAMTTLAFVCVVGLLVFLLAFACGMNNLSENSGVKGNVIVLSDGATDEILSNLGYGDIGNVEREVATAAADGTPLPVVVRVKKAPSISSDKGRTEYLASKETFFSVNQPIANTNPVRRRFVSVRALDDVRIASLVHEVTVRDGGRWYGDIGVDESSRIECVVGEGMAATLGPDIGKKELEVGDPFELGDMQWVVVGVMDSKGSTFGSELWVKSFDRITKPFGKESYTTLVMRTEPDNRAASTALAYHLTNNYTRQKLRAFSEPDYYAEQAKSNNEFLVAIVCVAVVVSIGGVFGMMTTMFANIAQRIRDIGVLRLLGFRRWQVLISFMLESLAIALIGGVLGCFVVWLLADGKQSINSISNGAGPGGKNVTLTISVGFEVAMMGLLFALAMGRLGGLVPALGAMRMKILDSLR